MGKPRRETAKYRIAVVTKALDSEFWLAVKNGAEDEAKWRSYAGFPV